jgi:hypothetical protein
LPDGIFSNQKSQFGYFLESLALEDVGIFYGRLVYFTAICEMLWPFDTVSFNLVYFTRFGKKIWQPWFRAIFRA